MKTFRILIVLVSIFVATVSTTVQAAAPRVSYIRLLSTTNPNVPLQIQARQAFQRMRPRLLNLQKQGVILAFAPEFKAGIVKVQYAESEGMNIASFGDGQSYDNIHDAIIPSSETWSGLQVPPPPAVTPYFYMELYSNCFGASDLGADAHVVGSLRDKTGRVVASYEGDADSSGDIFLDCFPWSGPYADVNPGYKVTFKVYDSTLVLQGTFSVFAPRGTFTSINKNTAVVNGLAPKGKGFEVDWYHTNWNAGYTLTTTSKFGVVPATSKWSKDMTTLKFHGSDELDLIVFQSANFGFINVMTVPYIYCALGSNYCSLSGFAFKPATLSVTHAGVVHTFTGRFDATGDFSVDLLNAAGDPIFLKAGDRVSGTGVPLYVLPNITANVNFTTDVVTGKVPANRFFEAWVYTLCSCSSYLVYSHSNSAGNYSSDFFSQVDMDPTQATNIEIFFQDPATGNITNYFRSYGP